MSVNKFNSSIITSVLRIRKGKAARALLSRSHQGEGIPLGFPYFGGYGGENFGSCLADTSCVVDRPPTHFFVKKKFIPAPGRELFSLRKKRPAGIRLSAWQEEGSLYRLSPPLFLPFKIMGFQRDASLWQSARRCLVAFPPRASADLTFGKSLNIMEEPCRIGNGYLQIRAEQLP